MMIFDVLVILFLVVLADNFSSPQAAETNKPNIVILATGGTIAGAAETGTQAGYTSGQVAVEALIFRLAPLSRSHYSTPITTGNQAATAKHKHLLRFASLLTCQ